MLKFQVTASSSRCSPSPQRLGQHFSSSSSSSSSPSSSPSSTRPSATAVVQHNVDRSIDELEECVVARQPPQQRQQMPTEAQPYPTDANLFCVTEGCPAAANCAVPFCRPFVSPSLSDLSPSSCSSSSSSSSSIDSNALGRRKQSAPLPPKQTAGELGYLRVYTAQIKTDTDYKTLRVPLLASTECVIRQLVVDKLRMSLRDLNLFHLFMEVRTRRTDGTEARSILELDRMARPLELQKCHPAGMSRFILGVDSNAIMARIYDGEVNPESNYKSVLISRRTCCAQVLQMLCQISRPPIDSIRPPRDVLPPSFSPQHGLEATSELRLFVDGPRVSESALIPDKCPLAGVYMALMPGQRIVLRRVILPRTERLS